MSIKLVAWVLDNYENDTCQEWKAMVALSEWAGPEGVCFPSIEKIGDRLNVGRSQTKNVLRGLSEQGQIVIVPPKVSGRGYYNAYLVVGDKDAETVANTLRTHKVLKGRMNEEEIKAAVANLVTQGVQELPEEFEETKHGTPPEPVEPEKESLFKGEFTAQKEIEMLLGSGLVSYPAAWKADRVRALQAELEGKLSRDGSRLSDTQKQLAIFFRYITNYEYPIKSHWGRWRKAFDEWIELFGGPDQIAELLGQAYASLLSAPIVVPPHPTSFTNTMDAIKAKGATAKPLGTAAILDATEEELLQKLSNPMKGT